MNCKTCPLNIDSKCFKSEMLAKIPLHFRNIFLCNNECSENPHKNTLCSRDLWVLTFISQQERFAMANAVTTMSALVENGFAELLCNLFENAPYEKRREMWKIMTKEYSHRLYLFDALFEKHSMAPLENNNNGDIELQPYQNCVMFPNLAYEAA